MISLFLAVAAQAVPAAPASATAAPVQVTAATFGERLETEKLGETTAREDIALVVQSDQVAGAPTTRSTARSPPDR